MVLTIFIVSLVKKHNLLDQETFDYEEARKIDTLQLYIFFVFAMTLTGTLVYFLVLDRRYNMNIKKIQLSVTFIFCLTILLNSAI